MKEASIFHADASFMRKHAAESLMLSMVSRKVRCIRLHQSTLHFHPHHTIQRDAQGKDVPATGPGCPSHAPSVTQVVTAGGGGGFRLQRQNHVPRPLHPDCGGDT